jgi:LPXTG-motif cell wall-anchored protein
VPDQPMPTTTVFVPPPDSTVPADRCPLNPALPIDDPGCRLPDTGVSDLIAWTATLGGLLILAGGALTTVRRKP